MGHRKVIENYYSDINNLIDILTKLIGSYRLLIGGANEANGITLASKKDVKKALKRASELGEIIDEIMEVLETVGYGYMDYCKLKTEVIKCHLETKYIETEIDSELKLKE